MWPFEFLENNTCPTNREFFQWIAEEKKAANKLADKKLAEGELKRIESEEQALERSSRDEALIARKKVLEDAYRTFGKKLSAAKENEVLPKADEAGIKVADDLRCRYVMQKTGKKLAPLS